MHTPDDDGTTGLTRRQLLGRVSLGLAGGALATLVAACSSSSAPSSTGAAPTQPAGAAAGGAAGAPTQAAPAAQTSGGAQATTLKILMWQGPTIVNTHLSSGTKDQIASRLVTEPLFTVNGQGQFSPVLATEVPSKENGGISADGKTVTYKLKPGLKWADGQPFTADDVVFTWQFATNKDVGAVTIGNYTDLDRVEAVDPQTVRLTFKQATGGWYVPFLGGNGMILPKHALADANNAQARNAPYNLKAFGTGPFMVEDFKPGDLLTMVANPNYRDAGSGKPFFKRIEIKGGGDATSAARAVLETGDYDYAWNLQVEAPVLNQMLQAGKGDLVLGPGSGVEQILFNQTDPNTEVDGERSSPKSKHPFLTDQRVRQAMALAIDRDTMAKTLYGQTGDATANVLTTPTNLNSKNTSYEFNIDKANQILDEAGYKKGGDGIRVTPEGVRMKVIYQTSINSLRQKEQALVKDGWQKIGIDTELKSVDAGVYFGTDPGNPDTTQHFYTDVEMFTSTFDTPFPQHYMERWYSGQPEIQLAQKSNQWTGQNYTRWVNPDYNKIYDQVKTETDVNRAQQLWIQLNDIVVNSYIHVPLIDRKFSDAKVKAIKGPDPGPFDAVFAWNVADWTRG
jgi:peptide/nickel transport system substrate-binding protein